MAARRTYLSVAALVRAGRAYVDPSEYAHSPLSSRLRLNVIEIESELALGLAQAACAASLYSHAKADLEKGGTAVSGALKAAMHMVPYKARQDEAVGKAADESWKTLVAAYRQMKKEGKL